MTSSDMVADLHCQVTHNNRTIYHSYPYKYPTSTGAMIWAAAQ